MTVLNLSVDELLSTTRAVRKRLDFEKPVEMAVLKECLELAIQAPTASNSQGWHFVVVTDPDKRKQIADLYRQVFAGYRTMSVSAGNLYQDDPVQKPIQDRVMNSAEYLAANLEKVPVFLIPCVSRWEEGVDGLRGNVFWSSLLGSIIPAAWSFMLAARSRGLGTCWTTLHLAYEKEIAELLGIPYEAMMQVALIPVAYTIGTDFKPAPRKPLDDILHLDSW